MTSQVKRISIEGDYRIGGPYHDEIIICKHIIVYGRRCDSESSEYGRDIEILCKRCNIEYQLSELIN